LGELHSESDLGVADGDWLLQTAGLLQITIGLTRRDTTILHHLRNRIWQMIEPLQQFASLVEALGFCDCARAIHMSQMYNHI
jgi:hypothetical protein